MVKNQHGHNIHHQQQQHHPHSHHSHQQQQQHHQQHQPHHQQQQQHHQPAPPAHQHHTHANHPQHQQQQAPPPQQQQQPQTHHQSLGPQHHYIPHQQSHHHHQHHHHHNHNPHPHHHNHQHHTQQQMQVAPHANGNPQQQPQQQAPISHHNNSELRPSLNQQTHVAHAASNRLGHPGELLEQQPQPQQAQQQTQPQPQQPAPHPQQLIQSNHNHPQPQMQRHPHAGIQQQQQQPPQSQQPVQQQPPPVANQQLASAPQHPINPHPYHAQHITPQIQHHPPQHQHHQPHHSTHSQPQGPPPPPHQHPSQHQPQLQHAHQTWINAPPPQPAHQTPNAVMPTARQPAPQGPMPHQAAPQQSPQPQQPHVVNARQPHPIPQSHMMQAQRPQIIYEQDRLYYSSNNPLGPNGPLQPQQPFDHTASTASHPSEGNIAPPPQQRIPNMNHVSNLPLTPPMMNTSVASTTSVHHMTNGPMMDASMSNRLPMSQHFNPAFHSHYMFPYTYAMGHYVPTTPNPAMMSSRLPANVPRYPPYDTMPHTTPVQMEISGPTPSSVPQPNRPVVSGPYPQPNSVTPTTPTAPTRTPRQKVIATIADPTTKRVISLDELKDTGASSQTSKKSDRDSVDASTPALNAEENSSNDVTRSSSIENNKIKPEVEDELNKSDRKPDETFDTKETPDPIKKETPDQVPKEIVEKSSLSGDVRSVLEQPSPTQANAVKDLSIQLQSISVSSDNKSQADSQQSSEAPKFSSSTPSTKPPSEASREISRDPSSERKEENSDVKPNQSNDSEQSDSIAKKTDLPYAPGQFSPSNPKGRRKYSIDFMWAICRHMNLDTKLGLEQQPVRDSFLPDFLNQNNSYSQRTWQSHSQQFLPKKKIIPAPIRAEVELKTVENPWVPELESQKPSIVEGELDTKRLLKVFRGHLNKLTPQKYDDLIKKIQALDLKERERLNSVINLVFDKAVDEPGFCYLYAKVCKVISQDNTDFNFLLVKKCQEEFETSDLYDGLNVEERKIEISQEKDVNKRKLLHEELYEDMRLRRKKYLGTIKLIGEMYKLDLLLPKIIGLCMKHLIDEANNENLECLCSLIATVGQKMQKERDEEIRQAFDNTLVVLKAFATNKKHEEALNLESRVRFRILDTIDLHKRNWKPRMVENNPKKIGEYEKEDRQLQMQNHANQSRMDDRDRNRRAMGGNVQGPNSRGPR